MSAAISTQAFSLLLQRHEQLTGRFARLLHDDAGQVLTAIALRLSVLEVASNSVAEVRALQQDLDDLLERFRDAQASLGGATVAKRGLIAALSQLSRARPSLQIRGDQAPAWHSHCGHAAFCIIEELDPSIVVCSAHALQATLRHKLAQLPPLVEAIAAAAALRLFWSPDQLTLEITQS
jgi:hypothetical protein